MRVPLTSFRFRYLGMQDVIDEALQKLYWACRGGRGFPGVIPDESSGRVSTEAILQGLGLHPPAVERLGLQASQSDSILDGVQSSSGRSYQRPDLRMDNLQRASTASSGQTPLSMPSDDQNALTDGSSVTAAGRRHTRRTPIEHEAERRRAGLEQPYPGTVESPIDPLMLQNGDLDPMDANFAMYPEAIAMESESRPQLDSQEGHGSARRGRGRGRGRGQTQQQTVQEDGFGPSNQAQWRRESAHTDGETLPWPGTLAAVYQDTNPRNDGAGFNEQNRRQ